MWELQNMVLQLLLLLDENFVKQIIVIIYNKMKKSPNLIEN